MTRPRIYGTECEMSSWLRRQDNLDSIKDGFSISDIDLKIHRYMMPVDGLGTRKVQALMEVEVKTHSGEPRYAQLQTMHKQNMFKGEKRLNDGTFLRHFGVFLLTFNKTNPDDSSIITWSVLDEHEAKIAKTFTISKEKLIKLLRFELHPNSLKPRVFVRHHATREIYTKETTELGFMTSIKMIHKS